VLQVVPDLGRKQHGLGRDAAPVQAGAAELVGLLDEGDLQPKLCGADAAGVAGGSAAEDDEVIDRICQGCSPVRNSRGARLQPRCRCFAVQFTPTLQGQLDSMCEYRARFSCKPRPNLRSTRCTRDAKLHLTEVGLPLARA
jgi:hypothetical protein